MPVTTPPRQPQPLFYHSHQLVGQKDSYAPSVVNAPCSSGLSPNPPISTETPASKATEQSIGSAQTPTKIAARPSVDIVGQRNQYGYEVKNTFIHYGSPLKTVSVVTPPKTVPCDFRPEVLFFDRQPAQLRTPAAVYHSAATPSTAGVLTGGRDIREVSGGSAAGPSVFLAPPPPPPPSLPFSAASNAPATTLRLSDFLNSPPTMTAMSSMCGGAVYNSSQAPSGGASYGWQQQQQPCAFVDTMPVVPPLPGQSCQAPCAAPPMASSHSSVPPPPPQFSVFDLAGSMQTSMQTSMQCATASYDPMAFMSGDPQLMHGGTMSSEMSQMLPQLAPQCLPPQQPPSFPVDQTSYQLSSQCGMSSMGGASYSGASMVGMPSSMSYSSPMNMGSNPMGGIVSCGSMVAEGSLNNAFCMPGASAGNSAFSISADHFPQPGSMQGLMSQMPLDTSPRLTMEGGLVDMTWM